MSIAGRLRSDCWQFLPGIYQLTDLIFDLWIAPDGRYTELDVDEFKQACAEGKLSLEWETQAWQTFAQLKAKISTKESQPGI
jgi:predicted RNA-binding protein associated with RNAse of E/G family